MLRILAVLLPLAGLATAYSFTASAQSLPLDMVERIAAAADEGRRHQASLGDIIDDGQDIHGEGVNVAARLEALAQPVVICLSKNVHEIVHKKTDFQFHDLGEQKVKNTVLHAVDITLEGITQRKLSKSQQIKRSDPWKKYLAAHERRQKS